MRKFLPWVAIAALFLAGVALIVDSIVPRTQSSVTQPELEPETAERIETSPTTAPSTKAVACGHSAS